jgi:hypothetical protein
MPSADRQPSISEMRLVVFTDRYEETVAFFRDGLGLPVSDGDAAAGRVATIFHAGPGSIEIVSEARRIGPGVMLHLDVSDAAAACRRLAAWGVKPLGPIDLPWGARMCGVGAPGGLLVNLVEDVSGSRRGSSPPPPRTAPPPDLAVVACADVDLDPLAVLGLVPGDAHVVTNAGGVVMADTVRDIEESQRGLGVSRVVVVQHHPCAFLDAGALPSICTPDPIDRLRASLESLTRPPLSLPVASVSGVLCGEGGRLTAVELS